MFGDNIVTISEFLMLKSKLGKIVVTSGGFDPIHPGHISSFNESKNYGDTLAVIVNGDNFLKLKKGKPFQDLKTRCLIVSAIKNVDFVIPFEIENDKTVIKALEKIKPHIFTKGGDRIDASSIPEWNVCDKYEIKVITGVGDDKRWSSSWFLNSWENHIKNKR